MASKKRKWWILILIIAVIALGAMAVVKARSKPKGIEVQMEESKLRTIDEKVSASGKVFPETEVKISSDVSGEIVELYVEEGDSVIMGQILAKIDPDTYISAVERGEASLNNSKANLATSQAQINNSEGFVCSIDTPSGLSSDKYVESGSIIEADWTLSFQFPKLSFFYPESQKYLGHWEYASIGLSENHHSLMKSPTIYIDKNWIVKNFKGREKQDHKGTLGHGALITGSYGMAGAAYLSAMGALRSGIGKLSCYVPEVVQDMIQTQVPEAICTGNNGFQCIESVQLAYSHEAVGLGCGIGMNAVTIKWLGKFLESCKGTPLIIDADGLNIMSQQSWIDRTPKDSIITPHPGEFKRLFGNFNNYEEAFRIQKEKAKELGIYIVLKIPNTRIATPEGEIYINSSGNPGMATAGSGDVLTGIITSLKSQGYSSLHAAVVGVYLHGLSGDLAAKAMGEYGLIARDLIEYLPKAIKTIEIEKKQI